MIQSDELIFFRGVGWNHQPESTRYGFRFQCWLIASYPEVGLVRYRQFVRYRPGSIDPFPTCKLAVQFPNASYLIFLACVRQLSCRPFAPKNGVPTHIFNTLLWMKYMHMSLRGITLLKTSVFRFLFYPQSELIFVLPTSPLAFFLGASRRADSDFPFWVFVAANRLRLVLNS